MTAPESQRDRWRVRIDSAGNPTEVNGAGERREHVHDWQPSTYAVWDGVFPCWRCSPCMMVDTSDEKPDPRKWL